jgi:glycosyltransferase involved in cell wall biosynthesis
MILGIDASNLRAGGGLAHLIGILGAAAPAESGFSSVVVWGGSETLDAIAARPWLHKRRVPALDGHLPSRVWWQWRQLSREARREHCNALLIPGGSYAGSFRPVVAISQNLLPFELPELRRYGWSWMAFKFRCLRVSQTRTFHRADGLVFLTNYARDVVMEVVRQTRGRTAIIPHGIEERFRREPRRQSDRPPAAPGPVRRVLYVSIIDVYKHQRGVAAAVLQLRKEGYAIELTLVGPAYPPALTRLRRWLKQHDPEGATVRYAGKVSFDQLPNTYAAADVGVFASSCENMPNILIEYMASGLPIACSHRGPMPEVLGDAGLYFDPEDVTSITAALRQLLDSASLRSELAVRASERASAYSWRRCASETFDFIATVAHGHDGHA